MRTALRGMNYYKCRGFASAQFGCSGERLGVYDTSCKKYVFFYLGHKVKEKKNPIHLVHKMCLQMSPHLAEASCFGVNILSDEHSEGDGFGIKGSVHQSHKAYTFFLQVVKMCTFGFNIQNFKLFKILGVLTLFKGSYFRRSASPPKSRICILLLFVILVN